MNSTGNAYRRIMYGVLLSTCAYVANNSLQMVLTFIGVAGFVLIYLGLCELCNNGGEQFYSKQKKWALVLVFLALVFGIVTLVTQLEMTLLMQLLSVIFFQLVIIFYEGFFHKTRKAFEEYHMMREAQKLRTVRKNILACGLVLVIIRAVAILIPLMGYIFNIGIIFFIIMISMQVQKMASMELVMYEKQKSQTQEK